MVSLSLYFETIFRKDCFSARKDKIIDPCVGHLFAIFYELTSKINVSLSLTKYSLIDDRMCSREELVLILGSACSQNPADIKAAEEKLKSLETEKGFYHALATVVSDVSVTVPVRWQAVLYVKNGIDRYW